MHERVKDSDQIRFFETAIKYCPVFISNSGNGDGNGGGNDGDGSKKEHSLFVYVVIGLIIVAAILLALIIIKICRQKCMLSFIVSAQLQLS